MNVRCPECQTLFRLADEKVGAQGAKVRCGRCRHVFIAMRPDNAEKSALIALPGTSPQGATLALDPSQIPAPAQPPLAAEPFAPPPPYQTPLSAQAPPYAPLVAPPLPGSFMNPVPPPFAAPSGQSFTPPPNLNPPIQSPFGGPGGGALPPLVFDDPSDPAPAQERFPPATSPFAQRPAGADSRFGSPALPPDTPALPEEERIDAATAMGRSAVQEREEEWEREAERARERERERIQRSVDRELEEEEAREADLARQREEERLWHERDQERRRILAGDPELSVEPAVEPEDVRGEDDRLEFDELPAERGSLTKSSPQGARQASAGFEDELDLGAPPPSVSAADPGAGSRGGRAGDADRPSWLGSSAHGYGFSDQESARRDPPGPTDPILGPVPGSTTTPPPRMPPPPSAATTSSLDADALFGGPETEPSAPGFVPPVSTQPPTQTPARARARAAVAAAAKIDEPRLRRGGGGERSRAQQRRALVRAGLFLLGIAGVLAIFVFWRNDFRLEPMGVMMSRAFGGAGAPRVRSQIPSLSIINVRRDVHDSLTGEPLLTISGQLENSGAAQLGAISVQARLLDRSGNPLTEREQFAVGLFEPHTLTAFTSTEAIDLEYKRRRARSTIAPFGKLDFMIVFFPLPREIEGARVRVFVEVTGAVPVAPQT